MCILSESKIGLIQEAIKTSGVVFPIGRGRLHPACLEGALPDCIQLEDSVKVRKDDAATWNQRLRTDYNA